MVQRILDLRLSGGGVHDVHGLAGMERVSTSRCTRTLRL